MNNEYVNSGISKLSPKILAGIFKLCSKGHVKLIKRVKIAHSFLVCVRSVPHYHFKLAYVILQMAV